VTNNFRAVLLACIVLVPPSQCVGGQAAVTAPTTPAVTAEVSQQTAKYIEQGDVYFNQGSYDRAAAEYSAAIGKNPKSAVAYWSRGKAYYFGAKALSASVDDFSKAIELDPGYLKAHYYRGLANIANGGYDRAINDFSRSIELDKNLIRAYSLRGWCYAHKAQWDQSSQLYLYQLFESDSGLLEAYKGPGWPYVRQTQWELFAVPNLIRATEQDSPLAEAYMNRGFAHFRKAQWAQAVIDLERIYVQDPGLNRNSWNKDWALTKKSQWDIVIAEFQRVIELTSRQPSPPSGSDTLKEELALAIADYNKAVEVSQDATLSLKIKEALKFIDDWHKTISKPG
jgi:tetratricopeptide (TPR) repeat protein